MDNDEGVNGNENGPRRIRRGPLVAARAGYFSRNQPLVVVLSLQVAIT